jgi:hypothetical protein
MHRLPRRFPQFLALFLPALALSAQQTPSSLKALHNFSYGDEGPPIPESASALPSMPSPQPPGAAASSGMAASGSAVAAASIHTGAFSGLAVGVKVGLSGIGIEIATPLSRRFNARVGGNYFSFDDTFNTNGLIYGGTLRLRSAEASVDWYPRGKSFHISPGALVYNGNDLTAGLRVPGGNFFSLNDVEYQSSTADPVNGSASLKFNKAAPKLTVGFGNHIPRNQRHFSVPFEIGFAYIGDPTLLLNLKGMTCEMQGQFCVDVATNPEIQSNLKAQQMKYQKDADDARFFPIVSVGFAYSF